MPRACVVENVRVSKFAEIRYQTNRYSVPGRYVGRPATIEIFADVVQAVVDGELVAKHSRLFGRHDASLDPMHILEALKRKHRAVERAEVFNNDRFPQELRDYLKRLVKRDRDTAGKQFLRVMELLIAHRLSAIVRAVTTAAQLNVDDPAAIELLVSQDSSMTVPALSADALPVAAKIAITQPRLDGYAIAGLKETAV